MPSAGSEVHLTPELIVAAASPEAIRREIFTAYQHDRFNWFRRPTLRLWSMAMRRVLLSRGFAVTSNDFIHVVERALNLR
jgi:Leu/Phe-tRNA-protein transferase